MNFSVVGPTYPFRGGISHHTSLLVRSLRSRHNVQFVSFSRQYPRWLYPGDGDRDPSTRLLTHEVPTQTFDALKPWEWRRAALEVAKAAPRLVILPWSTAYWSPFYWMFLRALRQVQGPKTVFICHNVVEHESSRLKTTMSQRVLRRGDFFIVHSQWDRESLLHWMAGQRTDRVWVCPHPVYTHLRQAELSKAETRTLLDIKAERVLLFFGFVRAYKGLRYLLESLPLVQKSLPVHLIIAGEVWEDPSVYKQMIDRLNLSSSVTFVRRYIPNEEVAQYFAAADIVVAPYVSATQSGIVQLAYGFGKPVIVGRVGGLPEAVEDGKTGYLVPPRNAEAIAWAITDFYLNRREPDMARAVQVQKAANSWDRLCSTIEEIAQRAAPLRS
jgi:glycosyltransferase involved in cell wall biosynthesis